MKYKYYLIIDDSSTDAARLELLMNQFPFYKKVGIANSILLSIEYLTSQHVDLIFLSVDLTTESGLSLFKMGITLPPVIVISSFAKFAVESYEIGKPTDFLLRPLTRERLQLALNRTLQIKIQNDNIIDVDAIFLKMGRKIHRFNFESIEYVEAFGLYSKIFTKEGQFQVVNERLNALVQLLPDRLFIRVHKSYLINISKITIYDRTSIWVNQAKIPIGVSFRPQLIGLLSLFDGSPDSDLTSEQEV